MCAGRAVVLFQYNGHAASARGFGRSVTANSQPAGRSAELCNGSLIPQLLLSIESQPPFRKVSIHFFFHRISVASARFFFRQPLKRFHLKLFQPRETVGFDEFAYVAQAKSFSNFKNSCATLWP